MGATRVLPSTTPTPIPAPGVPTFGTVPGPTGPSAPSRSDDDGHVPFYRRGLVLISGGIVVAAALAGLLYYLFFRPPPIILAPHVVTIPLPTPTVSMVVPDSPTAFEASLPNADLTYGLTAIEETPLEATALWPARFAESWTLTYGTGSETMTVVAYQHYHEADATAAFEALWTQAEASAEAASTGASPSPAADPSPTASASAPGLVERTPVIAGGVQVGESFKVLTDATDSGGTTTRVAVITWRNATGVFIMTADPAAIDDLFLEYAL